VQQVELSTLPGGAHAILREPHAEGRKDMRRSAYLVIGLLLLTLAMSPSPILAAEFEQGITLINTAEVKARLDAGDDMLLINTLSPIEIRDKNIPGSAAMPYEHIRDGKVNLPAEKDAMLVFYCKGPK